MLLDMIMVVMTRADDLSTALVSVSYLCSQRCEMKFGSWTYDGFQVRLFLVIEFFSGLYVETFPFHFSSSTFNYKTRQAVI